MESFIQCPYKYFVNKEGFTKYSIFHIGKQLHKYLQARMLGKDKAADNILNELMTLEERDFIDDSWYKLKELYPEYSRIDMNEMTY